MSVSARGPVRVRASGAGGWRVRLGDAEWAEAGDWKEAGEGGVVGELLSEEIADEKAAIDGVVVARVVRAGEAADIPVIGNTVGALGVEGIVDAGA